VGVAIRGGTGDAATIVDAELLLLLLLLLDDELLLLLEEEMSWTLTALPRPGGIVEYPGGGGGIDGGAG
jgi:hypothetical protein